MSKNREKARVPIKFSVRSYPEINETLPNGQTLFVPAHWRLMTEKDEVVASGPAISEHLMISMVRMMAAYTLEHPTEAREIVKLALNGMHGKEASNVLTLPTVEGSQPFRDLNKRIADDDANHNQLEAD